MSEYLIDTNILVYTLKGYEWASDLLAPLGISISIVRYGELYQGAHYAENPSSHWRISPGCCADSKFCR